MNPKRPREVVSYNMSRIRSEGTGLEAKLEQILRSVSDEFVKHPKVYGKPDFAYLDLKIAIFADSDFWHGYEWKRKRDEIRTHKKFWIRKIERNMERDREVSQRLKEEGWQVIRLWGHDINRQTNKCQEAIKKAIEMARIKSVG